MISSLKITITDNVFPIVERFQDDVKVGERSITMDMLYKQLLNLAPIDQILSSLTNYRLDDLEFYLSAVSDVDPNGRDFITTVLDALHYVFINTNKIDEALDIVLSLASQDKLSVEQFGSIVSKWEAKLTTSQITDEVLQTCQQLLLKAFKDGHNEETKVRLAELYKSHLHSIGDSSVKDWVLANLNTVPLHALKKEIEVLSTKSTDVEVFNFGKLPQKASFFASTSRGMTYFYDIPKSQFSVKYADARYNDVGHPRLLFAITVANGVASSVRLGALKGEEKLSDNTVIYKYPYSNVYDSGQVCWSGYQDLEIDTIPMMFLSAPNNSHLNSDTLERFKKFENRAFDTRLLGQGKCVLSDWFK